MGIQINGQTDTISATDGSLNIAGTVAVNVTGDATGLTGTPDITVGTVNASSAVISGDLTVNGTTTTLDTLLTEVDKLEVGANNTNVAVAITQSGSGDILRLYDSGTQVVTVKDGGSVGIGTDNPTSKLHINGGVLVKGPVTPSINFSPLSGGSGNADISFDGSDLRIVSNSSSANVRINAYSRSNDFVLKQDGKIGIGTDNPGKLFQVFNASSNPQINIKSATGGTCELQFGDNADEVRGNIVYNCTDDYLSLHGYNNAERLRITSSGNVGLSVTSPDLRLHVNGINALPSSSGSTPTGYLTLRNKQGGSSHGMFMGVSDVSPWCSWIQAQDANNNATTYPLLLNPNGGNIGIGTINPGYKLHVEGSLMSHSHYGKRSYGSYTFDTGYYFTVSGNRSVVYEVIVSGDPNHFGGGQYRATSVYLLSFGAGWTGSIQSAIWNSTRTIYAPGGSNNISEVTATFVLWDGTTEYTSGTARDPSKQLRIKVSGASTPNSVMIHIKQLHTG